MLFLISWTARPECRDAAVERFLRNGGVAPTGIRLLGRWHAVGPVAGFALAEAGDPVPIMQWVNGWSDLFSVSVHPAVSDEQLRQVVTGGSHAAMADAGQPIRVPQSFLAAGAEQLRSAATEGAR